MLTICFQTMWPRKVTTACQKIVALRQLLVSRLCFVWKCVINHFVKVKFNIRVIALAARCRPWIPHASPDIVQNWMFSLEFDRKNIDKRNGLNSIFCWRTKPHQHQICNFLHGTAAVFRCTNTNLDMIYTYQNWGYYHQTFAMQILTPCHMFNFALILVRNLPHRCKLQMLGSRCHGKPRVQLRAARRDPGAARAAGTTGRLRGGCAEVLFKSELGQKRHVFPI